MSFRWQWVPTARKQSVLAIWCTALLFLTIISASSAKVEINLATISFEIKSANAELAHKLDGILEKVSEPKLVTISEPHTSVGSQQTTPLVQSKSLFSTRKALSLSSRNQLLGEPQFKSSSFLSEQLKSRIISSYLVQAKASPQLASLFECSSNFYPEQYWLGNVIFSRQSLVAFSPYEEWFSANYRTTIYEAYYYRSPRVFKLLTLKITVTRGSNYWMVLKAPSSANMNSDLGYRGRLPYGLSKQLESRIRTWCWGTWQY